MGRSLFAVVPMYSNIWQVISIGTVTAYSATYSALVEYKILELFQY